MQTILITGASSGIGLACANKFAGQYNLILCSRNLDSLNDLKNKHNNSILLYPLDVTKIHDVDNLFVQIKNKGMHIDIVVNSAGLALGLDKLENDNFENWEKMIDTNIKGIIYVSSKALRVMKEKNSGEIINIGSIAGIGTYSKGVVYAATKAAVKSISDGLRKEVVEHNIKITNIQPGLVETNFSKVRFGGDEQKADSVYKGIKPLSADDIADIIKFVITVPSHVQINEITVTPVHQATVEVIHRKNI